MYSPEKEVGREGYLQTWFETYMLYINFKHHDFNGLYRPTKLLTMYWAILFNHAVSPRKQPYY